MFLTGETKEMDKQRIDYLLERFKDNRLSENEAEELLLLLGEDQCENLTEQINAILVEHDQLFAITDTTGQIDLSLITSIDKNTGLAEDKGKSNYAIFRFLAAACLLIILAVSLLLFKQNSKNDYSSQNQSSVHDVNPGTDKAILTLADGRTIILDNKETGLLVDNSSIKIAKPKEGQLQVNGLGNERADEILNIKTPRGGKYEVQLPDGSRVWLNAATSLKFPAAFTDAERSVELDGEAYFEIKSVESSTGRRLPFVVKTKGQSVEVLGTHFNINAYPDENSVKTTLLEGSVRVVRASTGESVLIKPGRQAILTEKSLSVRSTDVENVVSWKDNLFRFKDADIKSIMRQIARWYDVDIDYGNITPTERLTGYISRDVPLSKVLKMLEETGDMRFQIDARKVIVKTK